MHHLIAQAETADEALFACESCPRRFVVGKHAPKMVVLDEGDPVEHSGSLGAVTVRGTVGQ